MKRNIGNMICYLATLALAACGSGSDAATTAEGLGTSSAALVSQSYHAGPILQPQIIPIFMGNFTAPERAAHRTYLDGLAHYMSGDRWLNDNDQAGYQPTISQYGVRSATVWVGTDVTIAAPSGAVSDSNIQGTIAFLQQNGTIPAYDGGSLFVVFTRGVTFTNPYFLSNTNLGAYGSNWCSYHWHTTTNGWYSVVPFATSGSCTTPDRLSSHEIFNAATNPHSDNGWFDSQNVEVASGCNNDASLFSFGWVSKVRDNFTPGSCTTQTRAQLSSISGTSFGAMALSSTRSLHFSSLTTQDLGGTFNSPPVLLRGAGGAGSYDVFAQGTDNTVIHSSQNGGNWSTFDRVAMVPMNGKPAAISVAPSRIDVFVHGVNGAYLHKSSSTWPAVWPAGLDDMGGTFNGPPTVVSRGANSIDIFGRGTDGNIYYRNWDVTTPLNKSWAGPVFPNGFRSTIDPVVIAASDRYVVFGRDNGGQYVSRLWVNGTGWDEVAVLPGNYEGPPAAAFQTGTTTIDVVGQGLDHYYYRTQFTGVGAWTTPVHNGGYGWGAAAVAPGFSNGTTLVFIGGDDHGFYSSLITGNTWGGWSAGAAGSGPVH